MDSARWHTTTTTAQHPPQCTIMAARLTVRSYRGLPMLLRWSWRIRRQLPGRPGLAGYAVSLGPCRKTIWIVSAWTSRSELARFDRSALHSAAKAAIRPALAPSTFVVWSAPAAELPIRWDEARRRLAAADLRNRRPQGRPR
jgi:hypothetical protein